MPIASEQIENEAPPDTEPGRRLYRSATQRVLAGVCGGLGEYFGVDPVWFRIGFVVLTIGGGAGILIYVLMWLIVPTQPAGYVPDRSGSGTVTGAALVGVVFIIVGSIALVNTIAPSMGRFFWPVIFVLGGIGLVMGGLSRDNRR